MKKVLYIEDEPFLSKIVIEVLEKEGFEIRLVVDGAKVIGELKDFNPDIAVVDIMLPNVDGYTLCRQIKENNAGMPVIFLTAKVETEDLLKGFEAGGDDYMRKPFSMEELVARIRYQLKTGGKSETKNGPDEVKIGTYTFIPGRYELHGAHEMIKLSQREIEILEIFVRNINHSIDRKELLMTVWGDDSFFNSRNLDVYIRKLRDYFSADSSIEIITLKGKGYLFLVGEK